VRFVCVSDTHMTHSSMKVPDGDVLLHAGDFTNKGTVAEIKEFNTWLGKLPHRHKIVIAGNHDLALDSEHVQKRREASETTTTVRSLLTNCTYVHDEFVTVMGIKIYGSPYQPDMFAKYVAFSLPRGESLRKKWDKIPNDTDILLTHSPPFGYCDRMMFGKRVGCEDLLRAIEDRVRPAFHVFGHIHAARGVAHNTRSGVRTIHINAACITIVFDFSSRLHGRRSTDGQGYASSATATTAATAALVATATTAGTAATTTTTTTASA